MGFHTYPVERADDPAVEDDALAELARVIRPGGRLVTVDWSADGDGESGRRSRSGSRSRRR